MDHLVHLGDACDRGPDSARVLSFLWRLGDAVTTLRGDHDVWLEEYIRTGNVPQDWLFHGGDQTARSLHHAGHQYAHLYCGDLADFAFAPARNVVFVHAAVEPGIPLDEQSREFLIHSRTLAHEALHRAGMDAAGEDAPTAPLTEYSRVFVGHSATRGTVVSHSGVTVVDTGAGYGHPVSVVDVDSLRVWQSQPVRDLYPNHPYPGL